MKFVITGGPSTGKTTIVNGLANRGFRVVHEIATAVIEEGKILPWEDRIKFQAEVLRRQQSAEASILDFDRPVILDRGLFDGEAYYIVDKLPIPQAFGSLDASQYALAFLVEPLDFFDETDVRRENLEFTREISVVLEHCYTSRNVKVVHVPAMPPTERINFVHSQVEAYKKTHVFSAEQAALQASYLFRSMQPFSVGAY
jgi:predicted ATPase